MNNATLSLLDSAAIPSHLGSSKTTTINPSSQSKRPRPIVKEVDVNGEELAWDPETREQFTFVDGTAVRSGDSFAVVRPDYERWPLGHVSDVYMPTGHRGTVAMVKEFCSEAVEPRKTAYMSGHGYRVAHEFDVKHMETDILHGLPVTARLTIVHDHTGLHALKARMVLYVGKDAIGSIIGARAIHVANNPARWQMEVQAMVEKSILAQDMILTALKAADSHVLTEADKAFITAEGVNPPGGEWPLTLLDSVVKYHKNRNSDMTWGVWERRLDDSAIRVMIKVLGTATFGRQLDEILGGKRYSGKSAAEWKEVDAKKSSKK
jgi:hypothetical protein